MAVEAITADVFVEAAGHTVTLADTYPVEIGRRRARGDTGAGLDDPARERMREALREADFDIAAELTLAPPAAAAPDGRRRRGGREQAGGAPQVAVAVAPGESAVLLIEAEGGVFTWQFAEARRAATGQRRAGGARGQLLTFTIGAAAADAPAAAPGGRRGPVLDWLGETLLSPVRTYVLRFVVSKTIDVAVQRIEGDNPTGPVVIDGPDPAAWVPRPLSRTLPAGRPARVLLMVHGTFSSTAGSFGHLASTEAGRAFLTGALAGYDLVLGSDHRTLADDPHANAEALLATLTSLALPPGSTVDAVAYSRGGLVYRILAEQLLPAAGLDVTPGRAIFVACTNGGTHLAEPENWADMVDVYTNVVMAAARGVALLAGAPLAPGVGFAIRTLGRFVQMFSEVAISERKLPGLAAMEPDGAVVAALNGAAPAAGTAGYHAITSSFEPTGGLARGLSRAVTQFLVDRITDRLFAGPNDFVVDTAAMTRFAAGATLDPARVYAFGDTDRVYHTTYFADESVAARLAAWLELGPAAADVFAPPAPAAAAPAPPASGGLLGRLGERLTRGRAPVPPLAPRAIPPARRSEPRRPVSIGIPPVPPPAPAAAPSPFDPAELGVISFGDGAGVPMAMPLRPPGSVRGWSFAPDVPEDRPDGSVYRSVDPAPSGVPPAGLAAPAPAPAADEPGTPAAAVETAAPQPETVERYLAAQMEPYPPLGAPANVFVIVSPELIQVAANAAAAASPASAALDAKRRLTVELIPRRNCMLPAGDAGLIEIDVAAPTEIVTRLRVAGVDPGEAELIVEARQGTRVVASFLLRPVFVAKEAPPLAVQQPLGAAADDEGFPVLRIYEFTGLGGQLTLRFDLVADDPELALSEQLTLDPGFNVGAYVGGVLAEIEAAWDLASDSYAAFLDSFAASAVVRADALVPRSVRAALWENRAAIRAIQIVSDEALIPWELLCISDPAGQSSEQRGFLSEWGMVRWFHGVRRPPRTLGFDGANSRSVVPRYLDPALQLGGVEREEALLAAALPGIVPLEATSLAVRRFLERDAAALDVLHFACHGEAADKAVLTARLLMTGVHKADGSVIDDPLSADQVKVSLRLAADRPRSLVFLNSCQTGRGGRGIAGVAGFADAFLRPRSGRGAAAFVGALWSIDSALAETFAHHFYAALARGAMLVDAVHAAREACKEAGDFTWLAYSIYGHPMARADGRGVTE